ncbi:BolA family protein [Caenispirillum salinarum]|uniref:BolA family protein n=1 Tax=Caenispirillum salinarum TaxID=859058 RepID=UPI00385137A0
MPTIRERMERKLTDAFAPVTLEIKDDSHKHAGHADRIAALKDQGQGDGHAPIDGGGETHFRVAIVSDAFEGKSRVQRQRMVFDTLKEELQERIHALQLKTMTPEEARTE